MSIDWREINKEAIQYEINIESFLKILSKEDRNDFLKSAVEYDFKDNFW